MRDIEELLALIDKLGQADLEAVFRHVRARLPKHPAETLLNAPVETILTAILRASDLTIRGIEGIIAEAVFESEVLPNLRGWQPQPIPNDPPYDFLLQDGTGSVRIQVKMQRRIKRRPLMASEVQKRRNWPSDYYVVETQRTRTGKKGGADTRPYRFGSFDILAVSMGASRGSWASFLYTAERWLLPSDKEPGCLLTLQPVPPLPNDCWTDDLDTAVRWLRSDVTKTVSPPESSSAKVRKSRPS